MLHRLIFSSLKPDLVTHATNMSMTRMNMEEKVSEKIYNERRVEGKTKIGARKTVILLCA